MGGSTINSQLARAACIARPDLPARTLARVLMQQNPGCWATLNAARMCVQFVRGKCISRSKVPATSAIPRIKSTCPTEPWNPTKYLPKSDERSFTPFEVSVDRDTRVLVLSDIHMPYHSMTALTATLKHGKARDCRMILLNGDTLDFHRLSRFQKDPRARNAKQEIEAVVQFLDALDEWFPKARKIWKDGNHDERYAHYQSAMAPEITDIISDVAGLEKLLELRDRGWDYVTDKRPIYLGKLPVIHGHEYPTPVLGPVNAARGLFLRTKESALVSHHHQTSEHTETTISEKIITTWSIGCLCDLHPAYAVFNKWNQGFAEIELTKTGNYQVQNKRVHCGKILN